MALCDKEHPYSLTAAESETDAANECGKKIEGCDIDLPVFLNTGT
jgi:hypothetical protein